MTLRFVDSFDHYATADINEKWTTNASAAISPAAGRRSTGALRLNASTTTATKTIDNQATWIVGFAFKVATLPGATRTILALRDAGTTQVDVRLNTDGTLAVTRNGTVLSTTSFALAAGSFYFIELKATIHDTTGSYDLRVDGSSKASGTNVDTKNTANATANQVHLLGTDSSVNTDIDDLYVCDAAGSTNNNFLGDCRVDAFFPTGAGNTTQLTRGGTDSGANWSQVDETSPNDDTDYNEHATVGNKDTYACANMSHTPSSIFGAQILANAKKDDAGSRSLATVTRSGTTDFDGATQALSTSYVYYSDIREVDPNTSAAWTKTNFDASEHGVKVAA